MPIELAGGMYTVPTSGILIPSGDYSAADPGPIEFPTLGANALTIVTDVTSQTGANNTLTVTVEGFDPASGKWVTLGSDLYTAGAAKTYPMYIDPDNAIPQVTRQAVGNPAAGADFIFNVPTAETWQLVAASYTLTTAVAVANRVPGLMIRNSSATEQATVMGPSANPVTASQTAICSFVNGYSGSPTSVTLAAAGNVRIQAGIPMTGIALPSAWSVRSLVDGIQAADQISAINLTIVKSLKELYPRMRVRPVRSGTTTTLTYSISGTLSF